MSRASAAVPISRPTVLDYFLLLAGYALSVCLLSLDYVKVKAVSGEHEHVALLLPPLLRLTEGIILLWPLFFTLQSVSGRPHGLTAGEWLWIIAWLGTALLIGFAAWDHWGEMPEALKKPVFWPAFIWYVIIVPSLAVCALIVALLDLMSRKPRPWTHQLSLALVIWPVLPLAGILALGKFA